MNFLASLRRRLPQTPEPTDDDLPLPSRQFQWYMRFWHFIYLGLLALLLGYNVWQNHAALGGLLALLVALTAAQAVLYAWNYIYNDVWPLPRWRKALYFGGSILLWVIEWRIAPNYFWLILSYMGQMFGILSPLAAIPGTSLILVFIFAEERHWNFQGLTLGEVGGVFLAWLSFTVLFMFIYVVTRTSRDRAQLIQQLQSAQREVAAARARDTELATLRERERLARELHDSLGHALVVMSVQLEAIQRLYPVDPAQANARIEALKGVARANMDELRRALAGLRSGGLDDRPLPAALQSLCVATGQRAGLEMSCHAPDNLAPLTPAAAEALWRVAQEALTNVEQHARARHVALALEQEPDAMRLRISDDGRGLPPDAENRPEHYGLRGMRERVEGLGGSLTLAGEHGTVVEARVPLI